MPRPSEYTPARRYLMQAVMTAILGATIVLAVAVGSHVRRTHRVELSETVHTAQDVSIRLPDQWQRQSSSDDPNVIVRALEPGATRSSDEAGRDTRVIEVRVERLPTPLSPMQYAMSQRAITDTYVRDMVVEQNPTEAIDMAGRTGVLWSFESGVARRRRGTPSRKDVIAAAVLPSMRGLVVHLSGPGGLDSYDLALVREIADKLTVANEPIDGKPGESVTLVDGIRFDAPAGFTPAPQLDANRTDRVLFSAVDDSTEDPYAVEREWMTIETVGCLSPDFDAADPKQVERAKATFATLLLARDSRWRGANITPAGAGTWRADVPDPETDLPARAFLRTDPSGRALLTVLRGGFGNVGFDKPWESLAATVKFLPSSDVASLEDVGTAEASRLRRAGYEKLLLDGDVEWFLWTENDRHIGWSNTDFSPGKLAGRTHSRIRITGGGVEYTESVTGDFYYSEAAGKPQYGSSVSRKQSDGRTTVEVRESVTLDDGRLSVAFTHPKRGETKWTVAPPPPQYVPGALLSLVLGTLSADPMVLVTDDGMDGLGAATPLTVVIRPGESRAASTQPSTGQAKPLRCVTAQVNGSGVVSRWYFRSTGELELVEWPGGIKQIASDERSVKNAFPRGDAMSP